MRLVDIDVIITLFENEYLRAKELLDSWDCGHLNTLAEGFSICAAIVRTTPPVDAVQVVRCKDCFHYDAGTCYSTLGLWGMVKPWGFCSYGQRIGQDDNKKPSE